MKKRYLIALIISIAILTLTYKFWLISKAPTRINFDFYIFVIIAIISYLGGLKLTDYLADFKDIRHQSRIEIIFLTVFFILLFIPMSHLNKADKSYRENRALAEYKPLFMKNCKINFDYGKNFNNYFNDRFFGRNYLINLCILNKSILSSDYYVAGNTYLNKKNNYMFTYNIFEGNDNWNIPDKEEIRKYKYTLNKLNNYFENTNKNWYILVIPTREKALPKYQNEKLINFSKLKYKFIHALPEMREYNNIIYPINDILKYDGNEILYYKTDHHYTDLGAEFFAKRFFDNLNKKYPSIKEYPISIYSTDKHPHGTWGDAPFNGSLYNRLNLNNEKIFDVEYKFIELGDNIKIYKDDKIYKIVYKNRNNVNPQKIYLIGDSFVHSMGKVMALSFKDVIVRRDNIKKHELFFDVLKDDIEKENPDIVLFVYTSPHMNRFLKTFFIKNSPINNKTQNQGVN